MAKIYFSLQQANELVKKIVQDVERLSQLKDELELIDNTRIVFDEHNMESLLLEVELNKNFHEKNIELYSLLGYLIRKGCVIRSLDNGIEIDFYSKLMDRDIFLCWAPKEEQILFWHELKEQKGNRKPVRLLESDYFERLKSLK